MPYSRRQFIRAGVAASLSAAAAHAAPSPPRAPFRRLYNNDTTNLAGCTSPWHPRGAPFSLALVQASVDEVQGCTDVHLLAPGLCEVPWWRSQVAPLAEHVAWVKERYGLAPDAITKLVLEGGDLLGTFIQRCRERGQSPFLSFRLNDVHHKEHVDHPGGQGAPRGLVSGVSRWYHDHPQFRIGTRRSSGSQNALNFAFPEVRARKLALITEVLENYPFDGLELDLLRYYSYFPNPGPTPAERLACMLEVVQGTRQALDRTTAPGQHRWLSVRIPCHLGAHAAMGVEVAAFAAAGVDLFNLSAFYVTEQQTDFAAIARLVPGRATYVELTQTTRKGGHTGQATYDDFAFQRTTAEQMRTTAHLAFARGCAGVSAFNFPYFREHGTAERGAFGEPPFHVLREVSDPDALARVPQQHYFHTQPSDEPRVPQRALGSTQKPVVVHAGAAPLWLRWDLVPPLGGWPQPGLLRLQGDTPLGTLAVTAKWNGVLLQPAATGVTPFPIPYPSGLEGAPANTCSWALPLSLVHDGEHWLELSVSGPGELRPVFVELTFA